MINELKINGKDAFATWGVRMGDSFLENLLLPPPMKEPITNVSRLVNGTDVIMENRKVSERDVTLIFTIKGVDQNDYLQKYKSFLSEISNGLISINVPALGGDVYHLYYVRANSFALSRRRDFSKISIKFNEPNPANRV